MTALNKTLFIAGILASLVSAPQVIAGTNTPRVDQREANQDRRIDQGVESGRLTPGEAQRLETQQNRIESAEMKAKSDGVVTRAERVRLNHRQNQASRNIYRKKHNLR